MIKLGDCLEGLRALPDNSVDSIVTDPPYGLSFMGKKWDYDVPPEEVWRECLRVLKPGGHLLCFAGTRTQHRMAVRIEDAGFEIRDMIAWVYGSGFPKSLDVSKAIDKAAGAEREVIGNYEVTRDLSGGSWADLHGKPNGAVLHDITAPATDAARQWEGWGTALKPALEPITVARKPLVGTVAANVLAHGTGALNIDGCRIATDEVMRAPQSDPGKRGGVVGSDLGISGSEVDRFQQAQRDSIKRTMEKGRWPANLIHDGSDEVVGLFPASNGSGKARALKRGTRSDGWGMADRPGDLRDAGTGSAARFFYCAKASRRDRNEGCENMPERALNWSSGTKNPGSFQSEGTKKAANNHHPTVKPTDLMRYLCRLVTPPGGLVLDPYTGSGSTAKAAALEGFRFIGFEIDPDYHAIAERRWLAAIGELA